MMINDMFNYLKILYESIKYKFNKIKQVYKILNKIDLVEQDDLIHIKLNSNIIIENDKNMMIYNKEFYHNIARYIDLNPNVYGKSNEDLLNLFKSNPNEFNVEVIYNMFKLLGANVNKQQIEEFLDKNENMNDFIQRMGIQFKVDGVSQKVDKVVTNIQSNCSKK
jgi:hypothetical protein